MSKLLRCYVPLAAAPIKGYFHKVNALKPGCKQAQMTVIVDLNLKRGLKAGDADSACTSCMICCLPTDSVIWCLVELKKIVLFSP